MQNELQHLTAQKHGIYINEALSKTKFGFFNYVVIFMSGLIQFAVAYETCGCAFIIPVSKCDLNFTTGEKGLLSAISFVGIICSSHLWGFLADTKGRRKVMLPTLFMAFILSCASSLCPNVRLLIVFRFLNGFFVSGPASANIAYIGECHDNKRRGHAIMMTAVITAAACLCLPFLVWIVINQDWQFDIPFIGITYKPWRLFFIVCSFPNLIGFFMLIFLPESPKFVLGQGDKSGAYNVLQQIHRLNTFGKFNAKTEFEVFDLIEEPESIENRRCQLEYSQKSRSPFLASVWTQTVPLFRSPYLFATILLCGIQFTIYAISSGFFMFFADILNRMAINLKGVVDPRMPMCDVINMKSMDMAEMATTQLNGTIICITKFEFETLEQSLALEITNALSLIVICLLINRIGKFPILFFILAVSGACGIACNLIDIPLLQVYLYIAHLFCSTAFNVTNAVTVDIYPTASRAMAVFISLMFGRLGCIWGALTAALLLDHHCEMVFNLFGSLLIVMAILSLFIPNIHKRIIFRCNNRATSQI